MMRENVPTFCVSNINSKRYISRLMSYSRLDCNQATRGIKPYFVPLPQSDAKIIWQRCFNVFHFILRIRWKFPSKIPWPLIYQSLSSLPPSQASLVMLQNFKVFHFTWRCIISLPIYYVHFIFLKIFFIRG